MIRVTTDWNKHWSVYSSLVSSTYIHITKNSVLSRLLVGFRTHFKSLNHSFIRYKVDISSTNSDHFLGQANNLSRCVRRYVTPAVRRSVVPEAEYSQLDAVGDLRSRRRRSVFCGCLTVTAAFTSIVLNLVMSSTALMVIISVTSPGSDVICTLMRSLLCQDGYNSTVHTTNTSARAHSLIQPVSQNNVSDLRICQKKLHIMIDVCCVTAVFSLEITNRHVCCVNKLRERNTQLAITQCTNWTTPLG